MSSHYSIIFDLDGTLVDSRPGILESINIALMRAGLPQSASLKNAPIGPPLKDIIRQFVPSKDPTLVETICSYFISHYDTTGFKSTLLFPEISATLQNLSKCGHTLFIATNKRLLPTQAILTHLGIGNLFEDIYSVDSYSIPFTTKASMLSSLLSRHSITANCIYIGDRLDDLSAANFCQIEYGFPLWGYLNEEHMIPLTAIRFTLESLQARFTPMA